MSENLFDYAESVNRREAGLAQVEQQPWQMIALNVIRSIPIGWQGIGEDIRELVMKRGVGLPHHPNCWGALLAQAQRMRLLVRTGGMRNARGKKSHASTYPILRRI